MEVAASCIDQKDTIHNDEICTDDITRETLANKLKQNMITIQINSD
jgi:hypothetical protein